MMNPKYTPLFQPIILRSGIQLDNRVVMAPMTTSSNPDGTVSDEEVAYYSRRSNGVGMVVTACAYVTANGKGFQGGFGSDHDDLFQVYADSLLPLKNKEQKQSCKFSMAAGSVRQS